MTQTPDAPRLLDTRAPRYTSYPPATAFGPAVGPQTHADWLGALPEGAPLSLYLHVPFCRRLCWFCACRTQGTASAVPLDRYLDRLVAELARVRALIPGTPRVTRVHLGGGTPTLLSPAQTARLGDAVAAAFPAGPDAEISVEADPAEIDAERLDALAALGVNRASIGVQDFDPEVQAAIGRAQSAAATRAAAEGLRARGVGSLSVDLVYGLPHQTVARLTATLRQVLSLFPDRIALYGYAHVPWVARRQRMIPEDALPGTGARIALAAAAREVLTDRGYVAIGIDHFARPGDGLARAAAEGRLRRNFQGYTDDEAMALLGFGASSISRLPQGYAQNAAGTADWQAAIDAGRLPTARGHAFTADDRARGAAIERLMCYGAADLAAAADAAGVPADPLLADAGRAVADLPSCARLDGARLSLTGGFAYARLVAGYLDAHAGAERARYSAAS